MTIGNYMKKCFSVLIVFFCWAGLSNASLKILYGDTLMPAAGDSLPDWNGDSIKALMAGINPYGIAVDASGNLYIADYANNRVRKVTFPDSIITTIAGDGNQYYSGDGYFADSAALFNPSSVALDDSGNVYIADFGNNVIRKVYAATRFIATIAGNGTANFSGDGGAATSACLNLPSGIALDSSGNLYIADEFNNAIRKVLKKTGVITTIAGYMGMPGYTGDGGPAADAQLSGPSAVRLDSYGNIYIADNGNNVVREITAATGIINTIAGGGAYFGDDSLATHASFNDITDIAVDQSGNLFIADDGDGRVREMDFYTGLMTTVAGGGPYYSTSPLHTSIAPYGLCMGPGSSLWIADGEFDMVRVLTGEETGMQELQSAKAGFKLFPNPCSDQFTLQYLSTAVINSGDSQQLLEVFDLNGSLVFTKKFSSSALVNITGLAQGVYSARVTGQQSVGTQRLVVIK